MFRSKIKKTHKLLLRTGGIILDVGTKADLWNSWFAFNFSMERKWYSNSVKETRGGNKGIKVQGRWASGEKALWGLVRSSLNSWDQNQPCRKTSMHIVFISRKEGSRQISATLRLWVSYLSWDSSLIRYWTLCEHCPRKEVILWRPHGFTWNVSRYACVIFLLSGWSKLVLQGFGQCVTDGVWEIDGQIRGCFMRTGRFIDGWENLMGGLMSARREVFLVRRSGSLFHFGLAIIFITNFDETGPSHLHST